MVGSGGRCPLRRTLCLTPPRLPLRRVMGGPDGVGSLRSGTHSGRFGGECLEIGVFAKWYNELTIILYLVREMMIIVTFKCRKQGDHDQSQDNPNTCNVTAKHTG